MWRVFGAADPPGTIHQLKITLCDIRPPIWRRVQVPSSTTLGDLHIILQALMPWDDSHLHVFAIGGEQYADDRVDDPWGDASLHHEDDVRLEDVAPAGTRFDYEYDFGDSWRHRIVVEKVLPPEPGSVYPRCLAGRRACPPEDCGGAWGYADLVEAISAASKTPEQRQLIEWLGAGIDPEAFDRAAVNARFAPETPEEREASLRRRR